MNIVNFVKYHIVAPEDVSILGVFTFNDNSTANILDPNPGNGYMWFTVVDDTLSNAGKSASDVKKLKITKNCKTASGSLFANYRGFTNMTEGVDLTEATSLNVLDSSLFDQWTSNTQSTIAIPSNVVTVGNSTFRDWSSMTNGVDLSGATSLEEIRGGAFMNWASATQTSSTDGYLHIPSSVNFIEWYAFEDWSSMTKGVDFSEATSLTSLPHAKSFGGWINAQPSGPLVLPSNLTQVSWTTETGHSGPNGGTFSDWTSMQYGVDLTGNASLNIIGGAAFSNWENANMSELYIPASVTQIESWAFVNWKSMTGSLRFGSITPPTMIDAASNVYRQFYGWDSLPLGIEVFVPPTANLSVWKAELSKSPNIGRFKSINGTAWALIP